MCVLCFSLIGDYSGTHRRRLPKMLRYINRVLDRNASHEVHDVTTRSKFGIMILLTFRLI